MFIKSKTLIYFVTWCLPNDHRFININVVIHLLTTVTSQLVLVDADTTRSNWCWTVEEGKPEKRIDQREQTLRLRHIWLFPKIKSPIAALVNLLCYINITPLSQMCFVIVDNNVPLPPLTFPHQAKLLHPLDDSHLLVKEHDSFQIK